LRCSSRSSGSGCPHALRQFPGVVVDGLARRAGRRISFWQFTRHGLIVTAIALAVPCLRLRYFAFT
jgi:hypothetical protein